VVLGLGVRHWTRFPCAAATAYTWRPTLVEPTKVTPRTWGC
jgi:hypothetical protein